MAVEASIKIAIIIMLALSLSTSYITLQKVQCTSFSSAEIEKNRKDFFLHGGIVGTHDRDTSPTGSRIWMNPVNSSSTSNTIYHINATSTASFPKSIASFDDLLLNINTTMAVPENLHIALAGDSITRYQYISLVYFLKFGKWIDPDDVPNMVREKHHDSWSNFYEFTKDKLHPFEQCDCFRPEGHKMAMMNENRYFKDPIRNNSVSYFQKFGHKFAFKSQWNYSDVNNEHELVTKEEDLSYVSETLSWPEFITNFVANLDPKPNVFIFNQGIHPTTDFRTRSMRRLIVNAIKDSGMISIYKTTTKYRDHNITNNGINETDAIREYEEDFCEKADYCLDLSWTWNVPATHYCDYAHFVDPVYSWFNVQLLELLASI